MWGNDREILTYDDAGGAYYGYATIEGTTVRLHGAPLAAGPAQGRTLVMVLNGTGAHEYRRVAVPGGVGSNDNRTWTLDRPFSAAVGGGRGGDDNKNDNGNDNDNGVVAFIQIMPARVRNLHVRNFLTDAGAYQVYGHGTDIVMAENVANRMTGFLAWGQWRGAPGGSSGSGPRPLVPPPTTTTTTTTATTTTAGGTPAGRGVGGAFGVGMNPTTRLQMLSNVVREGNNIVNVWLVVRVCVRAHTIRACG